MRSSFHLPKIEVGDNVVVLRVQEMLHGRVIDRDENNNHYVVAVGPATEEGDMTITDTITVPPYRLTPLGVGRWAVIDTR